jgi:UDP:flavonoid glycosyltransferase YjiC (YdhE family)
MKIAFVILGTRGDVQPIVALADGLIKKGHEVTICAPPENEELISRVNCSFISFGPSPKKAAKENQKKKKEEL